MKKPISRPLVALDVSALLSQPVTGIQRVMLELVPRLCHTCFARGLAVALVDSLSPRLRVLFRWQEPVNDETVLQALDDIATGRVLWGFWYRCSYGARVLASCLGGMHLKDLLKHSRGAKLAAQHLRAFLKEYWAGFPTDLSGLDSYVGFSAGILPMRLPDSLEPRRTLFIVHDLIPVRSARWVKPNSTRMFGANLVDMARRFLGEDNNCRIVTPSWQVAHEVQALFRGLIDREVSVRATYWGYARDKFYPDSDRHFGNALGVPADSRLVLAVSTRDPRKRFGDIETAIHLLNAALPVHGLFIGQGTGAVAGHKHACYLGHVADDLLRRAYSSCDVYVNWSAAEGFGLPVVEALACGARVIVPPDNNTLREIGGNDVIVADAATPAGLARALATTLMGERTEQPVPDLTRFDWETCCRQFEEELWNEDEPAAATRTFHRAA